MLFEDILNIFVIVSLLCAFLSLYFLVGLARQIKRVKILASIKKLLGLSLFSAISILASLLFFGVQGYQGLTHETLVAHVIIVPIEKQRYNAIVEFKNGEQRKFELAGDEIMFEANVLKWRSWAQIFGLETVYRMDRIRGRFKSIDDERTKKATIYSLNGNASVSISDWREKYQNLSYLLDVEHGSASYTSADSVSYYDLMITSSGLLLRPTDLDE